MKKDNLLTSLLGPAALLLVAVAAMVMTSCSQDENEPGGTPSGSKITLVPTVASTLSWSTADNATAPGTRADASLPVTLTGGEIKIGIARPSAGGGVPGKEDVLGINYYSVSADGKLTRLSFANRPGETEAPLGIDAPGEYYVAGFGNVTLKTDGISYDAYIESKSGNGEKVTISADGKISLPLSIASSGLRLNVKNTDGTDYTGADVLAMPNDGYFRNDQNEFLAEKTLTATAPAAIWGECNETVLPKGSGVLKLTVAGKVYNVLAPRQISFTSGRLYTFNVRVGATGITVSSDDLGIADFDVESVTNAEAKIMSVWDGTIPAGQSTGSAFSGGDGKTEATAYVIGKAADLAQLAADVNAGCTYDGKYFRQTVGIDLDNKAWTPIGNDSGYPFAGHYDGKGYMITNLKADAGSGDYYNKGLFNRVKGSDISLKNIHVSGSVNSSGGYAAGICCEFEGTNTFSSSTGDIQVISGCSFTGTATGQQGAAGICVSLTNSILTSCANYGNITLTQSAAYVGGIVGNLTNSVAAGCYNAGTLAYSGGSTNGIAMNCIGSADNKSRIIGCYNIGTIDPTNYTGNDEGSIGSNSFDCYAIAPICNSTFASGVTAFGTSWISASVVWTAGADNDGTFSFSEKAFQSAKFWKSLGSWNGGNPVYPKLWWE